MSVSKQMKQALKEEGERLAIKKMEFSIRVDAIMETRRREDMYRKARKIIAG